MFLQIFVYKEQNVSLPYLNYNSRYRLLMKKFRNNTFRVAILLMLSTAPLGVSYSYAENEENLEFEEIQYDPMLPENSHLDGIKTILTEKVVNGKLEVMEFVLPKDTTNEDMKRILSLEGTSGWSYINSQAYHSGIVLFDGNASRAGDKYWKISVNGTLNLFKGELDHKLSGKSNSSTTEISESPFNENLGYRVIFSGKMIESDEENVFAIAFMNSTLKNPETGIDIKILQFGSPTSESVSSIDCTEKVRNSFLVI